MTMVPFRGSNQCGFDAYKHAVNRWKNVDTVIDHLINCAARSCNYLLNVGPNPDGVIQPEAIACKREVGLWLGKYGEAVYDTERILPN